MVAEVFVDTGGFYAALVAKDDRHTEAAACFELARASGGRFLTTDYVLDEAATLLKARGMTHLALKVFATIDSSSICKVHWTDPSLFGKAKAMFLGHADHAWSFTDCVSFCVMRELRIKRALTKDSHFREAGFEALLA